MQRSATVCFQSSMVTLYGRNYIGHITDTQRLSEVRCFASGQIARKQELVLEPQSLKPMFCPI